MECWSDGLKRILECKIGNANLHPANGLLRYNSDFRTPNSGFVPSFSSVVYQKSLEIEVSSTNRLRGVFSEDRKILPHSIERQLGPESLPSTAPEDGRLREGSLLCLHHAPDHGLGGVPQAFKNLARLWRVSVAVF
jgi:hypothetical protein